MLEDSTAPKAEACANEDKGADKIEARVSELHGEMQGMKEDVLGIKGDVQGMKGEVSGMKTMLE